MNKLLKGIGNKFLTDSNSMLKELHAKLELMHIMPKFFPFSNYTISCFDLNEICKELALSKPQSLLEFGSGLSTLVIAKLFENNLDFKIISIEHDLDWINFMNGIIVENGLTNIEIIHSKLIEAKYEAFNGLWYDLDLEKLPLFDVILVDGPPCNAKNRPYSRFFSINAIKSKLKSGGYIYLDDADRPGEKKIIHDWVNKELVKNIRFHKWGRGVSIYQ